MKKNHGNSTHHKKMASKGKIATIAGLTLSAGMVLSEIAPAVVYAEQVPTAQPAVAPILAQRSATQTESSTPTPQEQQAEKPQKQTVLKFGYGDASSIKETLKNSTGVTKISFDRNVKLDPDISNLFSNIKTLQSIDFTNADTSQVTNMSGLFSGDTSLTEVTGLHGNNLAKVTDMSHMFENTKLSMIDMSDWNVSNVTNISNMFANSGIMMLDLSKFNNDKVQTENSLSNASNLMKITFGKNISLTNSGITGNWAKDGKSANILAAQKLTNENFGTYVKDSTPTPAPSKDRGYDYDKEKKSLDFHTDDPSIVQNTLVQLKDVKSIKFSKNIKMPADISSLFAKLSDLTNIDLSNVDLSEVTDMTSLFSDDTSLIELTGIDGKKLSNVTDMTRMFQGTKISFLDMSGWNVSNVSNIQNMFTNSGIMMLDLSQFTNSNILVDNSLLNTESLTKITYGNNMSLQKSGLAGYWTKDGKGSDIVVPSDLTNDKAGMYIKGKNQDGYSFDRGTSTLTIASNVSGIELQEELGSLRDQVKHVVIKSNTKLNPNISHMFSNMKNLTSVDFSNANVASVRDLSNLFENDAQLKSVDLSMFTDNQATSHIFKGTNINKITISKGLPLTNSDLNINSDHPWYQSGDTKANKPTPVVFPDKIQSTKGTSVFTNLAKTNQWLTVQLPDKASQQIYLGTVVYGSTFPIIMPNHVGYLTPNNTLVHVDDNGVITLSDNQYEPRTYKDMSYTYSDNFGNAHTITIPQITYGETEDIAQYLDPVVGYAKPEHFYVRVESNGTIHMLDSVSYDPIKNKAQLVEFNDSIAGKITLHIDQGVVTYGTDVDVPLPTINGFTKVASTVKVHLDENGKLVLASSQSGSFYKKTVTNSGSSSSSNESGSGQSTTSDHPNNHNHSTNENHSTTHKHHGLIHNVVMTIKKVVKFISVLIHKVIPLYNQNFQIESRTLAGGTDWYSDQEVVRDGKTYIRVSTNEYVLADDVYAYNSKNSVVSTKDKAVSLVNSQGKAVSRSLGKNTAWKSDRTMEINGKTYYRVSTNEFVSSDDVTVK